MKKHAPFADLTNAQLELQRAGLEDRIQRMQEDLKTPLESNLTEQAEQMTHRNILSGLLRHEMEYLQQVRNELQLRKQAV